MIYGSLHDHPPATLHQDLLFQLAYLLRTAVAQGAAVRWRHEGLPHVLQLGRLLTYMLLKCLRNTFCLQSASVDKVSSRLHQMHWVSQNSTCEIQ